MAEPSTPQFSDIAVRVQPRASKNALALLQNDSIKVWTTSAPTDGQANQAVLRLLAKALGIAPSRLAILRGDTGRDKLIRVSGLSLSDVRALLQEI